MGTFVGGCCEQSVIGFQNNYLHIISADVHSASSDGFDVSLETSLVRSHCLNEMDGDAPFPSPLKGDGTYVRRRMRSRQKRV